MALTINSQTTQFTILRNLSKLNQLQAQATERLSTTKRINRASDDPAGLIAVSQFNSELTGVDAALGNAQRANSMLDTAGGALTEISSLLSSISTLVAQSGSASTLTAAEKAANQMQIDSAIDAIDRIVRTTTFNGQRLLDGSYAIGTSMSTADAAKIGDVRVYSRPSEVTSGTLSISVSAAATQASTSETGWIDMAGSNATLSAATTLTISGKLGSETITIASGSDQDDVIDAINAVSDQTGVVAAASATTATAIKLTSSDYGESAFVSVSVLSGDADFVGGGNVSKTTGTDATVTVNGSAAMVDGVNVNWSGNGYSVSFTLADNTTGTRTINVADGGATFQLGTDANSRATLGIASLNSHVIGEAGTGYLSDLKSGGEHDLATDPAGAARIISKAVVQVAQIAARIGGFQKYQVQSTVNALTAAKEGLTDARSAIEDADIAEEMSNLSRYRLLSETSMNLLAMVNSQSNAMLSLLLQ